MDLERIPFTSYDFWAYLSAGAVLLVVADYVAETGYLSQASWTFAQGLVGVISAYVLGQVVASFSALVFETWLVKRLLGFPRNNLFGTARAPRFVRMLLPGYFRALPMETQAAALARGKTEGIDGHGEALFWAAYSKARLSPAVMVRLDNFLNLYGFCRNMAMVGAIAAIVLAGSYYLYDKSYSNVSLAIAAAVIAVGLTLRYLKFYRVFAVEVFTSYAYNFDRKAA
jgi:hypothetical protein